MDSTEGGGNFGPSIGFGPAPDGKTILDIPLALLSGHGKPGDGFYVELDTLMLGTMANEGMGTSYDTDLDKWFPILVRRIIPGASNETLENIRAMYNPLSQPA